MISRNLTNRYVIAKIFHGFCFTVAWSGVLILGVLLFHVTQEGIQWLDLQFLSDFPSRFPAKAGIHSALIGTLWLISLTALFSVPIGIGAGLYLEEFTKKKSNSSVCRPQYFKFSGGPIDCIWNVGFSHFCKMV